MQHSNRDNDRVLVCHHVAAGEPIRFAGRGENGELQFLCGANHSADAGDRLEEAISLELLTALDASLGVVRALRPGERVERSAAWSPWVFPEDAAGAERPATEESPRADSADLRPSQELRLLARGPALRLEARRPWRTSLEFRDAQVIWTAGPRQGRLRRGELKDVWIQLGPGRVEVWASLRSADEGRTELRLFAAMLSRETVLDLAGLRSALARQDFLVQVRHAIGIEEVRSAVLVRLAQSPPGETVPAPYERAWARHRRRRRRTFISLAGFVGTFLLGAMAGPGLGPGGGLLGVLAVGFWVSLTVTSFQQRFLRCPRCRHVFAGLFGSFDDRCVHCKLPMGAKGPD